MVSKRNAFDHADPVAAVRQAARRYPGEPIVIYVWRRSCEADLGPVVFATDQLAIVEAVTMAGGRVVRFRAKRGEGGRRHDRFRALYFTCTCTPWGEGAVYQHIGLVCLAPATAAPYRAGAARW